MEIKYSDIKVIKYPSGCEKRYIFPKLEITPEYSNEAHDSYTWVTLKVDKYDDNLVECLLHFSEYVEYNLGRNTLMYLDMPYLLYAREDKDLKDIGGGFPLRAFLRYVVNLGFSRIFSVDVHSGVATNTGFVKELDPPNFYFYKLEMLKPDYILAPDAGGLKRAEKQAEIHNVLLLQGSKVRDQETGKLSGFELPQLSNGEVEDIKGKTVCIIDDIIDGGGTFIMWNKILKEKYGVSKVYLLATHGIFSKGKDALKDLDYVSVYNDMSNSK
jgi:ribose-phosphate pyrophosphokinase